MINIKVLGPGCNNCVRLAANAHKAIEILGIDAVVEKVTDYNEIHKYPILATPGLVINDKLVAAGRIPDAAEIVAWLKI